MTEADVTKPSGVVVSPADDDGMENKTKQVKELQVEDFGEGEGDGAEQGGPS